MKNRATIVLSAALLAGFAFTQPAAETVEFRIPDSSVIEQSGKAGFSEQDLQGARYEPCGTPESDIAVQVAFLKDGRAGLVGRNDGKTVWTRILPLARSVNPAKASAVCKGERIQITSQEPFSARTTEQTFQIDQPDIRLSGQRDYDKSSRIIADLYGLAFKGQLQAVKDYDYSRIQYPFQYVTAQLLTERMGEAGRIAEKKSSYQPAQAALILQTTLLLSAKLGSMVTGSEFNDQDYGSWMQTYEHTGLERNFYTDIFEQYAALQMSSYRLEETIRICRAVLEKSEDDLSTRILLADALWQNGDTKEASEHYAYADRVSTGSDLPPRVKKRMTSAGEN